MTAIRCNSCGKIRQADSFCPECGSSDYSYVTLPDTQIPEEAPTVQASSAPETAPEQTSYPETPVYAAYDANPNPQPAAQPAEEVHENVIAGIGGAILFSLGGVIVYVILYQFNFIASISAFIMFTLAALGYGIFSGNRKSTSLASVLTPIIVTVVMIFVAEYLAVIVSMYIELKSYGYTIPELAAYFPQLLEDSETRGYIIRDLVMAFLFGALGTVGSIIRSVKARKAAQSGQQQQQ